MKKFVPFIIVKLLFACLTYGQAVKRVVRFQEAPALGSSPFATLNYVCDSLVWPNAFGQSITFNVLMGDSGYLSGTNIVADQAKGNFFDLTGTTGNYVTRALVGLGDVNGAGGMNLAKPVYIRVLDGTTGTPGAVLGTYNATLGELKDKSKQLSIFNFTPAVPLPASKKIFLVLAFPDLVWGAGSSPANKDTLTLLSTAFGQVSNPIAWEQYANGTWTDMESTWGNLDMNNHIYPLVSTVDVNCTPPLPVTFGGFRGVQNGPRIDLGWQTWSEENNARFEVERSDDGLKYSVLGTVATRAVNGNHQGLLTYQFTDLQPLQGNNFYRIKQVDKDGSASFSSIIKIFFTGAAITAQGPVARFYPNPAGERLMIELGNNRAASSVTAISIADARGRITGVQKPAVMNGGVLTTSLRGLSSGIYFITLTFDDGSRSTFRIMRQ